MAVADGGVEGMKLGTTLLLSLPPLVMVDESSDAADAAAPPVVGFIIFLFIPAACFFRPRYSPVPRICASRTVESQCSYIPLPAWANQTEPILE
jgi:hypothetical protein